MLGSLVAVGIVLAACQPKKPVAPPPAGDASPAPPADPAPKRLGDTSSAYTDFEADEASGEKARERPGPAPVNDRDAAIAAVVRSNSHGALDFLSEFVAQNPADREARVAMARAQAMQGDYDGALSTLGDKAGHPDDVEVVQIRASLLRRRGKQPQALKLVRESLKTHPKSLPLRGELLDLLVAAGGRGTPEATSLMDGLYDAYGANEATTAADLLAVARAALARGTKGAFKDANMVLEEAEALAKVEDGTWIGDQVRLLRGDVFLEKYAAQESMTTFELLLERDAWHADALAGTARVYANSLQFGPAARVARETLQVNPEHAQAHAVLARIALIEGRRDEARSRITDHVLAVNAQHTEGLAVLAGLAILESGQGDYEKWRDQALRVHPRNGRFFTELSEILGFLHLYPEADTILKEAAGIAPDNPYVLSALGINLLRLGVEQQGREALQKAWKKDPFNERTRNLLNLYEDSLDLNYTVNTLGDLTLRLPNNDREFVEPVVAESLRWSRSALDKAYGFNAGALRAEFFSDPSEFSIRTVGVPSLGAVAVCFGPVITFIGPYQGVLNIENVIRHELGHVYAIQKSKGRVPRWFTEGLSEWESELADPAWARESAELLSQARSAGKLRRLSELELAFIRAESSAMMEVAYSTSAYAIRYLGTTYGRPKLIAILGGYADGKTTAELFRQHLGKDLSVIEKEFEAWFFAQLDAKVAGWEPSRDPRAKDKRNELFRTAIKQAESKSTTDAVRSLQSLITNRGDGYATRMMLARLLLDGPQPAAAKRHLVAARKFHTEALDPLVQLAKLAEQSGDIAEEKKLLQEALTVDGDSFDPAARLLVLAILTDDNVATKIALRRCRGIAPLHPLSLAASALVRRGVTSGQAQALVKRALKSLDSGQAGPADTRAVVALAAARIGDDASARRLATEALQSETLIAPARAKLKAL